VYENGLLKSTLRGVVKENNQLKESLKHSDAAQNKIRKLEGIVIVLMLERKN